MLVQENTGLVVVDIQGKLARLVHDSDTFISNCVRLIQGAKALDLPVIFLEHNPEKLGSTVEELDSLLNESDAIKKYTFNACDAPDFVESVSSKGVNTWLICGMEAHVCVYQTAKGLINLGYKVALVSDCISSRSPANIQLGIDCLKNSGVDATGLEMCLYELVKDSRSPVFKKILELIR